MQLGRGAEAHRQAAVDEDVEMRSSSSMKRRIKRDGRNGRKDSVEKTEVVADDVVLVVGELDALALFLAAPLALHAAHEKSCGDTSSNCFQLGQEPSGPTGVPKAYRP